MTRELLVFGEQTFKINVPEDAKITFGPWSPPTKKEAAYGDAGSKRGTLRVYRGSKENGVLAVFSGVTGFRDLSLGYSELVAKEEGAAIWKSDKNGYEREDKVKRSHEWTEPHVVALTDGGGSRRRRR